MKSAETSAADAMFEHDAKEIEEMRHHVRVYLMVFGALAVLTVVTVGASYLHVDMPIAILIAVVIASIKAGLVACYFMHLISEKKLIYSVLVLTAVFFVVLMALPMSQYLDPGVGTHVP
jgi:cytochrome c oxidase subunit 4